MLFLFARYVFLRHPYIVKWPDACHDYSDDESAWCTIPTQANRCHDYSDNESAWCTMPCTQANCCHDYSDDERAWCTIPCTQASCCHDYSDDEGCAYRTIYCVQARCRLIIFVWRACPLAVISYFYLYDVDFMTGCAIFVYDKAVFVTDRFTFVFKSIMTRAGCLLFIIIWLPPPPHLTVRNISSTVKISTTSS